MLYQSYRAKIAKTVQVLGIIHRFRILIIAVCAALLAMTVSLLAVKGIVSDVTPCPENVTMGDNLGYTAKAVLGRVSYEYAEAGTEDWTTEKPLRPGDYRVRAVGMTVVGSPRYGNVYAFTILPREITVKIANPEVTYGDYPAVTADLAYADKLQCNKFEYEDELAENSEVEPLTGGIKILDAEDNDVTDAYIISTEGRRVSITRRNLTVEGGSAEKVYDGTPLINNSYNIAVGSVARTDRIIAYCSGSQTNAGESLNSPSVRIVRTVEGEEVDVTSRYNLTLNAGKLKVTQREIQISTASNSWIFDNTRHTDWGFNLTGGTTLAKGHSISATSGAQITDVGQAENVLSFAVFGGGENVTANYSISQTCGTLTVTPRPITIYTRDDTRVYDGKDFFSINPARIGGMPDGMTEGYDYSLVYKEGYARINEVGSTPNRVEYDVYIGGGNKSSNFEISYNYGTLTVTPLETLITTYTYSWYYDALGHSIGYQYYSNLAAGHVIRIKEGTQATITDVGSVENTMQVFIADSNGADKSANYVITYSYGTLTVLPREITVYAGSAYKEYDGTPLTCAEYSPTYDYPNSGYGEAGEVVIVPTEPLLDYPDNDILEPVPGWDPINYAFTVSAKTSGSQTDAGTSSNVIVEGSVHIFDGSGRDVTYNYSVTTVAGALTVNARLIKLRADDATKIYDGKPLTEDSFSIVEGSPVAGHTVAAVTSGTITNVGTEYNVILSASVSGNGADITHNYDIRCENGILTVTARPVKIITASDEWTYDGEVRYNAGYTVFIEEGVYYPLADNEYVYVDSYVTAQDAGEWQNVLGISIRRESDNVPTTANYDITYEYGTITVFKRQIILTAGDATKVYDGTPLTQSGTSWAKVEGKAESGLVDGHRYTTNTSGSQTDVGSSANTIITYEFYDGIGYPVTSNYEPILRDGLLTVTTRYMTVTTNSNSWMFDGATHFDGGYSYGYSDGGEWIDSPYTVAVGQNANTSDCAEVTYVTEGKKQNTMTFTVTDAAGGDVTQNYSITVYNGTLEITHRPIIVKGGSAKKVYDGDPLTCDSVEALPYGEYIAPETQPLVSGHRISGETYGARTDVGISDNPVREGTVVIMYGDSVMTENYEITGYEVGKLEVTKRFITVTSGSADKIFDGDPLTEHSCEVTEGSLITGHKIQAEYYGNQTDVGDSPNGFTVLSITDGSGNTVYSCDDPDNSNYAVGTILGTLTVNYREITITAGSASKVYNGAELICKDYTVTAEPAHALPEGHEISVVEWSSVTDCPTPNEQGKFVAENNITVTISYKGSDVTANYLITYESGTLEVTPRPIAVASDGNEWTYDGDPKSHGVVAAYTQEDTPNHKGLLTSLGHEIRVLTCVTVTDADTYDNEITVGIYDLDGMPQTSNYSIIYAYRTLIVNKRQITVAPVTAEKVYDGTPLECTFTTTSELGLVKDHKIEAEATDGITDEGSVTVRVVADSVKICSGSVDVSGNYQITCSDEEATLTVTPRPVTVYTNSNAWTYDGDEHWDDGIDGKNSDKPVLDHVYTTQNYQKFINAGVYDNVMDITVTDGEGNNVSHNYDITPVWGTLVISPRGIVITVQNAEKVYNGSPLYPESYVVSPEDGVLKQHSLEVTLGGSRTDAGESWEGTVDAWDVKDSNGVSVRENYTATIVQGLLKVTKRNITVTTEGNSWVYGGNAYSYEVFTAEKENGDRGLLDGQSVQLSNWTKIEDFGTAENNADVKISAGSANVTKNYQIEFAAGTLEIQKRTVKVLTEGNTSTYDGNEHTYEIITLADDSPYDWVDGQTADVTKATKVRDVCNGVENTVEIGVTRDSDNKDTTGNYKIEFVKGKLTVEKRAVTVWAEDTTKVYDGTPLTCTNFGGQNLVEGHVVQAQASGSITYPDETGCAYITEGSAKIYADGTDVTANYDISYDLTKGGLLTVTERPITVKTNSNKWAYDGEEHYDNGFIITEGTLAAGHAAEADGWQKFVEKGKYPNVFDVRIYENGAEVTQYYEITYDNGDGAGTYGVLEIYEDGGSGGGGGDLDDSGNIGGGGGGDAEPVLMAWLYSDRDATVYLRYISYGGYKGTGWDKSVPAYYSLLDGKYSMNYLTSLALYEAGYEAAPIKIEMQGSQYMLPYYMAIGDYVYQVQTSDVVYSGDTSVAYTLGYYQFDYSAAGSVSLPAEYAAYESAYCSYVRENYLSVPSSSYAYLKTIIDDKGWTGKEQNIIGLVAQYIQNAAAYNLDYNEKLVDGKTLDECGDMVVSFLRDYKEGVCRHYASAATLMYRSLGIPARYVEGLLGQTRAGERTEVMSDKAHAWVEVYIDGLGWVKVEVTGSGSGGGGDQGGGEDEEKTPLNIYSWGRTYTYDGTKHFFGAGDYFCPELPDGYTLNMTGLDTIGMTEAGSLDASMFDGVLQVTIFDENGNDVTQKFDVNVILSMTITKRSITVTSASQTKEFDGTPLKNSGCSISLGSLAEGHRLEARASGAITDVGSTQNTLNLEDIRVLDSFGNDVTANYSITANTGTLTVTP